MITALVVYLSVGALASLFALVRAFTINADLRSDLSWSHVATMLVGLVVTWPLVLAQETYAWLRDR